MLLPVLDDVADELPAVDELLLLELLLLLLLASSS
jgi:hypothetical protein